MEYVTLNNGVTQRKSDLTGSVSNVDPVGFFNSGLISSPESLFLTVKYADTDYE